MPRSGPFALRAVRQSLARRRRFRIATLAATFSVAACNTEPNGDDVLLCAFDTGTVQRGRCPTLCEHQCRVAQSTGCERPDCIEACERDDDDDGRACHDARFATWRCIVRTGRVDVACAVGNVPIFTPDLSICRAEWTRQQTTCPAPPPLPVPDAAPPDAQRHGDAH